MLTVFIFKNTDIKVSPAVKKRGRPKGSDLTVSGLPKKKQKGFKGPCPFIRLHTSEKERGISTTIIAYNIVSQC